MTLRIILRETDDGAARNVGGPVNTEWFTIEIEAPLLETLLRQKGQYMRREVVGVELVGQRDAPRMELGQ